MFEKVTQEKQEITIKQVYVSIFFFFFKKWEIKIVNKYSPIYCSKKEQTRNKNKK